MRIFVAGLMLVLVAAACTDDNRDPLDLNTSPSAIRGVSLVSENSDVNQVLFTITSCADSSVVVKEDVPLEDQMIPEFFEELANNPLDENSAHLFADYFKVLEPGCYNVHAQPLNDYGEESRICHPAWKDDVIVHERETTEIFLMIQCDGTDLGALDVIAALNHEPFLEDVVFDDSKFVCGATETICMKGSDVDNDPLEFELIVPNECTVTGPKPPHDEETCFEVTCRDYGRFDLIARVYDLAWKDGALIRIEDWLAAEGYPNESHSEINFWAYFGGDDWPMFHHDPALSGVAVSSAPMTNDILWTFPTETSFAASPVVVRGIVYIGGLNGVFYALDSEDGMLLWSYNSGSTIHSTAAVADGQVFFMNENGDFHNLDAATGGVNWIVNNGNGPWDWSSPTVHDGNVFVAWSSGTVFSLDAATGLTNWNTLVGNSPNGPIAVVNGKVFSGTHNTGNNSSPTLVALDEVTGAIVWTYDYYLHHGNVVGMINSNGAAVVDGDGDGDLEVYFGVYNFVGTGDQTICLDEATGAEIWTANVGGNSTSTPAVHNGRVFIGSDDNHLYALDAATGTVIWRFLAKDSIWTAPAVADGVVYMGSLDHTFYAVDETTGSEIWQYYTGASRLESSPALYCGVAYVGNENGNVYAFGPGAEQ